MTNHNEDTEFTQETAGLPDAHRPNDDYLSRAEEALQSGDTVLATHLFIAFYEQAQKCGPVADDAAVAALRKAWDLACETKERSLAEYIFDKLEGYLSAEESQKFAVQLQNIALDKLSEFGISRSDLEDVAEMISEELGQDAHIASIRPVMSMNLPSKDAADQQDGEHKPAIASADVSQTATKTHARRMRYADLVGYDSVIRDARELGLGVEDDEAYRQLVAMLSSRHGLDGLSAAGSFVFRTSSRDDASAFMSAVVGELDLPALRVQMSSGPMGVPMLSMSVSTKSMLHLKGKPAFESPGVLVLEDIDMWGESLIDAASATDGEGMMFASMSRAARETVAMVTAAVEDPDVYVLVSVGGETADLGYLYDLMEPMNIIDIYLPDELERRQIWDRIAMEHPSVRALDLSQLTRMSRNLSRTDIVTAAREAVEDAYRQGLKSRRYQPITQELMFEHISNFQPLDSSEYRFLEDAVVTDFRKQIVQLEDDLAQDAQEISMHVDARGPVPSRMQTRAQNEQSQPGENPSAGEGDDAGQGA